jgi:phosphinothricin acetyltransferase
MAQDPTRLRAATAADAEQVARIYNHYVRHTCVTFEEQPVAAAEIAQRMREVAASSLPWFVAELEGRVVGYAYAGRWRVRSAYRFSAETTVYLEPEATGRKVGTRLMEELLRSLRETSLHVVIAGIALPNPASIALHERLGFHRVATFEEVGFKLGRWIDVAYWQAALGAGDGAATPRGGACPSA